MIVLSKKPGFNMDMRMDSFTISVKVNKGTALLEGSVSSPEKKRLAETHALSVAGIEKVINNLEVVSYPKHDSPVIAVGIKERKLPRVFLR